MKLDPGRILLLALLFTSCAAAHEARPPSLPFQASYRSADGSLSRLVPLRHADPAEIAATFDPLVAASARAARFRGLQDGGCVLWKPGAPMPSPPPVPRIVPLIGEGAIVVQAEAEDLARIAELIRRLDEGRVSIRREDALEVRALRTPPSRLGGRGVGSLTWPAQSGTELAP